jgi:hypothetical protein
MKLPCSQCNKTFSLDDFVELVYCDDGIHFLCSKDCQDEWDYPIAEEKESVLEEQTIGSSPS